VVTRTITTDRELWDRAKKRAGSIPISGVIRRLLEMWLAGEIKVTL
jgi:hypothetical protein